MTIRWKISKEQGNHRPMLHYSVTLSEFEKGLALPMVRMESAIPRPPESSWGYCWPERHERGPWTPREHYLVMTPSHREGELSQSLKLPWREDNAYPEVEESFEALRKAFEQALHQALASPAMQQSGELETSAAAKRAVAPSLAARRLLRAVKP